MPNYKQSKIYELRCNITNKIYYGSTTQKYLSSRLTEHKRDFMKWLKDNNNNSYLSSFEILKNGDYKIILVENFECKSKDELRAREQHYIDNNDCINKNKAYLTEEDKTNYIKQYHKNRYETEKEKEKQYSKKYYQTNKEEITQRHKDFYKKNKEKIVLYSKNYSKNYYKTNKEKENERHKKYNDNNKEKIKQYQKIYNKKYQKEKRLFLNSWGYEKKVFSCNLLNIDLSIFK